MISPVLTLEIKDKMKLNGFCLLPEDREERKGEDMEDEALKALPTGVEDFEKITTKNYYYVDKTWFIKELLDKKGEVNLFTRPRRFGKSLAISMFQHFFDMQYANKKHVFEGLRIMKAGEPYLQHQNAYPVVIMTFKNMEGAIFSTAFNGLMGQVSKEYGRHAYLLESEALRQDEKEHFKNLMIRRKVEKFDGEKEEEYEKRVIWISKIAHADDEAYDELEHLIAGGTLLKPINDGLVYADILETQDNLWNFFYFKGYLTKVKETQSGVINYFELRIPNKEVLSIYRNKIRDWFDERVKETDRRELFRAILEQDVTTFEDEIIELLADSISYMDSQENFYHGFLTGILGGLKGYRTVSNRESGNGRGDIFIKPRDYRKAAIIIEVKIAKSAQKMGSTCDEALAQIEAKNYVDELWREGYSETIKYGIAFYRKSCRIKVAEQVET